MIINSFQHNTKSVILYTILPSIRAFYTFLECSEITPNCVECSLLVPSSEEEAAELVCTACGEAFYLTDNSTCMGKRHEGRLLGIFT